MLIQEQK